MAHQLDFHVTLWSDNPKTLLRLEKSLNALTTGTPPGWEVVILSNIIDSEMGCINKADVHSVDINWDDAKEVDDWQLEGDPADVEHYRNLLNEVDMTPDDFQDYWELNYDAEEED